MFRRWARLSLLALPFVAGLACSPRLTMEQFELPKHAALCLLLPGLLAGGAAALAGRSPPLLALLGVMAAAALRSPRPAAAWLGDYENLDGMVTWGLAAACFLAGADAAPGDRRRFQVALLAATAGSAVYALAQAAGLDPFRGELFRHVRAFAGNPDFLAQQMAMALPVAACAALGAGWGAALSAVIGLAAAVVLGLTASRGGAVAAAAGLAVAGWLTRDRWHHRRGAVVLAATAFVLALAGAEALLPPDLTLRARVADLHADGGFTRTRGRLWLGVARAAAERPVLGWGPEGLRDVFLRTVPPGWADTEGLGVTARNAHDWPIQLAVTGGAAGVLAFLWLLVAAGRRPGPEPPDAGLAGAAVAWLVHNLVSFGGAATAPVWWAALGLLSVRTNTSRRPPVGWVAVPAATLAFLATVRLTADAYAYRGNEMTRANRNGPALPMFHRAGRLAPWEGVYFSRLALAHEAVGHPEPALAAFERAAALAPLDGIRVGHVARLRFILATAEHRPDEQEAAYRLALAALDLAPSQPSLYGTAIMQAQTLGRHDEVVRLAAALRAREPGWAAKLLGVSSP